MIAEIDVDVVFILFFQGNANASSRLVMAPSFDDTVFTVDCHGDKNSFWLFFFLRSPTCKYIFIEGRMNHDIFYSVVLLIMPSLKVDAYSMVLCSKINKTQHSINGNHLYGLTFRFQQKLSSYPWQYRWDENNWFSNYHYSHYSKSPRQYRRGKEYSYKHDSWQYRKEFKLPRQYLWEHSSNQASKYHHLRFNQASTNIIKKCHLNRAFKHPVHGPNGMIIYDIVIHHDPSCVHVEYFRRNKSCKGWFNGKIASQIIARCLKAAPIGELAKGLLAYKKCALLHIESSQAHSTPDEGRVASRVSQGSRKESRRAFRKWMGFLGEVESRALIDQATPSLKPNSDMANNTSVYSQKITHQKVSSSFRQDLFPSFNSTQGRSNAPKIKNNLNIKIGTLNVEGLKEIGKHSMLISYMKNQSIDILAIQETHVTNTDSFKHDNYWFYFSGNKADSHAGVGFIVSPRFHLHVRGFKPITSRIAVIRIAASPRSLELYSIYAPSQIASGENSVARDLERKQQFWDDISQFCNTHSPYLPIIVGDFNARWDSHMAENELGYNNPYVGNFHFGDPPADTQYSNNSSFLFQFLQEAQMYIPTSFIETPGSLIEKYIQTNMQTPLDHNQVIGQN